MTRDHSDSDGDSPATRLPDEQRGQYEQIVAELDPYIESGSPTPALEKLDRILGSIPDDEEHALLRAGLVAERGGLELDVDRDESALEDVESALEAGWEDAPTYTTGGWARFALGRAGAAREYFDRALEHDPDHVSALTGRSLALLEIEEYDLARSDLTHAIKIDGQNPELYALRGEAHIGLRDLEKAERDTRKARRLAPDDPDYAVSLARLKLVQGEAEAAAEAIDAAIDDEEEAALEALLLRSHLSMLSGDSETARRDAIRASNQYPDEAFAFVQLVHVQLAEGNLSLARKAADRAVRLDPSLPDAYMVRGTVLQMQGETEAARDDLERARQAPAELPMFLLGSFYEVLEASGFSHSMRDLLDQYTSMYERRGDGGRDADAGPGVPPGGFGDFDPSDVMDRMFDDSGELDDRLEPFLEMAMQNAPNILQNLPSGLVQGLGGVDPSELEDLDLSDLSKEELEAQLEQVYEMMQSGRDPFSMFDGSFGDDSRDDED